MTEQLIETGLTETEFNRRRAKIEKDSILGVALTFALTIGNAGYHAAQVLWGKPQKPEGYQTYLDAQTTHSNLVIQRDEQKRPDLPYRNERLDKVLEGVFDVSLEKLERLNQAISILDEDISRMQTQNPVYSTFADEVNSFQNKHLNYELMGSLGILAVGLTANKIIARRRRRKLETIFYKKSETSEEEQ